MNGALSLMQSAASAGIELCFANPGTTELPLVAALDEVRGIRAVLGLFEGVCTGAADGYARMAGRPALTLLHLGPGFANGIANLHNARRARSPVVNLIGDQASWHLPHDAPLSSDIASLASPVSAWVRTSGSSEQLAADGAAAIAAAWGPPAGVASLIVPADHQWGPGDGQAATPTRPASGQIAPERVTTLARALRSGGGERTVLLLGGSALGEGGQRAADRIRCATGARVFAETFPARWERGAGLPAFQRLPYFPEQVIEALAGSDLVILAGAREPVAFFGIEGVPSVLAPPDSAMLLADPDEDAATALEALATAIGADKPSDPPGARAPEAPPDGPLDLFSLGATVASILPEGAIVIDEAATSGVGLYGAAAGAARHSLLSLTGGAIGQGLPCAAGAALACPDRKVIALQADGSALYTPQALWTHAREGLDIVTVLCSNRAYRILQLEIGRSGVADPGEASRRLTELAAPEIDWVSLARGFGVPAERVETNQALAVALQRALREPGPRLIEASL